MVPVGFVAVTSGSGSLQISSFRLDGTGERYLTSGPANHHLPSVSPDGAHLLYTGDDLGVDEIYGLDLGHPSAPTEITRPPLRATSASWSPDGHSILFSALAPGSPVYQIFIASADGTNPRQLTRSAVSGNAQPVYSPDARHIAYINGREANEPGPNGSTVSGLANRIWVMDADGSNAAALTPGPLDAYPAWLDAKTVAFARTSFLSDSSQVVAVGLDGSERTVSPAHQYFIEPKPLPDARSYGATLEAGGVLRVVRISRVDGAALTASTSSDYTVNVLPVPRTDGSSLTLAWILAAAPAEADHRPIPLAVYAAAAAGLVILMLGGAAVRRKTNAC